MNFIYFFLIFFLSNLIFLNRNSLKASTFKDELISPVNTTHAKIPFLTGTALTIITSIFEDQSVDPIQAETQENKPLGKYSKWGDLFGQLVPNVAYSLSALGYDYFDTSSDQGTKSAVVMVKATLYAGVICTFLKHTIKETRPNKRDRLSFPSGHSTTIFAFSSVVHSLHGWEWGIPAYLVGAFVGFSRMNDNQHWLHDVLAGATLGLGYGLGISQLSGLSELQNLTIYPVPTSKGSMLMATYSF